MIRVSVQDGIATVLIDRAEKRNCLSLPMWIELGRSMDRLSADHSLRCVLIRGAGEAAFSAGADIAEMETERDTPERDRHYGEALHDSLASISRCIHPTVAAISGWCMGGGAGIATKCDFRIAGESMRLGIPARALGIFYSHAWLDPILQMAGYAVACELLIEGRIFTGAEALQKGLIGRLVPDGSVFAEAQALAQRIAAGAPLSNRFHKRALQALRGPFPIPASEIEAAKSYVATEDFRNAVRAFMEKRKPVFEGR
jgi:enoyl-CoA hydratase